MERNIHIVKDTNGINIVLINDIRYKGKREEWSRIEEYLKQYVGKCYEIEESKEIIIISKDFPDEFANSESRIPVRNDKSGMVERYNVYKAIMVVRHSGDGNKYLYDFVAIKKETSSPLEP